MNTEIKIQFDNPETARHFAIWLCDSPALQDYWTWMEKIEKREQGDTTAIDFDFHNGREFLGDGTIRAKSGRLDRDNN